MKSKTQSDRLNDGEFSASEEKTNDLRKQYHTSLKKIDTILHIQSKDLDAEKTHDLRVEIKKINKCTLLYSKKFLVRISKKEIF